MCLAYQIGVKTQSDAEVKKIGDVLDETTNSSFANKNLGEVLKQQGLTLEEFDEQIASVDRMSDEERQQLIESGNYQPSYMWNVNGWLCDKL